MPRPGLTSEMASALQAGELLTVMFVYAKFLDGEVRLWTGYGPLEWNGQTWQGIGTLLSISSIEEGTDVEFRGITLGLSGFDANLIAEALGQVQQGLPVVVYLGLFYPGSPYGIIRDPLISWAGRMDQPVINAAGDTATISLSCENRLSGMNVAVDRRLTHEDQSRDWPLDTGLIFVVSIQDQVLYWGRTPGQK